MDAANIQKATKSPIFRLPVEILHDIFFIVAQQSKTVWNIRLTCRYWRNLVAADNTLPRHLAIRSKFRRTPHSDYQAHTKRQFSRALHHLQGANFELGIDPTNLPLEEEEEEEEGSEEVPWYRFRTQCTSLEVTSLLSAKKTPFLNFLNHLPTLENLTHLSLSSGVSLALVMQHTPLHHSSLRSLTLLSGSDLGLGDNIDSNTCAQHIFTRLKSFHTTGTGRSAISVAVFKPLLMWFRQLEELVISEQYDLPDKGIDLIQQSVDWKFQLKILDIRTTLLTMFPPSLLRDLTHLTLHRDDKGDIGDEIPMVDLPQLISLSLHRSRIGLFRFNAPNLRDLHLKFINWEKCVGQVPILYPTLVKITDIGPSIKAFLTSAPFPDIHELHIDTGYVHDHPRVFLPPLATQPPPFPNLRHLVMKSPRSEKLEGLEVALLYARYTQLISVRIC